MAIPDPQNPVGAKGIPEGWKPQNWGHPKNDFTIVENDGHHVLELRSHDDGSTISKDIKGKQTDDQKAFQELVESHGHRYAVCRSIEDVAAILRTSGS